MTTLREAVDLAASHARKVKDDHVAQVKGKPGLTDINTAIEAFRSGEPIAVAHVRPHRDMMLAVAEVLATGLGADVVAMTHETYAVMGSFTQERIQEARAGKPITMLNPDTGRTWEPGELGAYVEAHGPDDVVSEALSTTVANRAGDVWMFTQPYRIEGRSVTWHDLNNIDGGDDESQHMGAAGLIPDVLRKIMAQQPILQKALQAMPEYASWSNERLLAINDATCASALPALVARMPDPNAFIGLMLFAVPGTVRHQVLTERFGRGGVTDPRRWN